MALTGCAGNDDYDPLDTAPDVLSPPVLVHPTREEVQAEVCAQPPEFFGPADTSTQRYPAKYPNGVTVIYHRGHEEPDNIVAAQVTVDAGPNWSAVMDDTHRKHKVSSWALQVIVADMLEGMP